MKDKNSVFIASSIDGFIADKNGGIDWLHDIPNPDNIDMGYGEFTSQIDAIIMGRVSFETVCGFDIDWPYNVPVFVLSSTLKEVPDTLKGKVFLLNGSLTEVLEHIHNEGYHSIYIDGGKTIQSFLKEDLIDNMIITTIPILLGGGTSLFSDLAEPLEFECTKSIVFAGKIVQNHFIRVRKSI